MSPVAGNNDGEASQNTVYLTTSLDTRLVTTVSGSDTVSDFKERILLQHRQCFPAIGYIEIHSLKVKRRGVFYHLTDSMPVKSAFGTTKKNWFVSVDASRLEQDINNIKHFNKHKIGDLAALTWVTHNCSINGHYKHESLSIQPKTIPFVNQIFSNVDGDSCEDVSNNVEEDMSSVDKHLAISKKIISKKRPRDVSNENLPKDPSECGLFVKKKTKTQKVTSNVKALVDNIVSTYDDDDIGKYGGIEMNNENSFKHKSKNEDLIGENTRINNGDKLYDFEEVATVDLSGLEGAGEETVADVAMVLEKNIQHKMCEKEKDNELVLKAVVENEIPTLSTRIFYYEHDITGLNVVGPLDGDLKRCTKQKATEKEVSSKILINKLQNINKDVTDSSQQDVGSNGHDFQDGLIEVKLPERRKKVKKSKSKNKNKTKVMHDDNNPVGDISSIVSASNFNEKVIGEKNEVLETPLVDEFKKYNEMIMNEMEVSEATNNVEYTEEKSKNNLNGKKRKKDIEKNASKNDKSVKNDNVLMNNDDEVFRNEKNLSQEHVEDINNKLEGHNGKIDGVKKEKRKKKNKKSVLRNEDNVKESSLPDGVIEDANAKKNNKYSLMGPQDLLSKDQSTEVELELKNNNHIEDTLKNVTVYEVSKVNNEDDITKDESHEINFMDHFAPGYEPDETAFVDDVKDEKKLTKKKKDDSMNNNDIQSQKMISKNEYSLAGPQDRLSKHQSTEFELESKKSQSVDHHHHHHPEVTSDNVTVDEVSKVNNEVITNDESHETKFLDHFAPGHQLNETASVDNVNDTKKPKKKKKNDFKNDGDIKSQNIILKNEGLVRKATKKNNKSSLTGPQDPLSKHQSTEFGLKFEKSQSVDHQNHHLEDTSNNNVTVSEAFKVNNEDVTNDESHEINFLDYFAPGHQLNETASIDNGKDTKNPQVKTKDDSMNDGGIKSQKTISKTENNKVVTLTDTNIPKFDQIKIPKTARNTDDESSSGSKSFGKSSQYYQKSNKKQSVVGPVKNVLPVLNSLYNKSAKIFGEDDDGDISSADDNATVNSNSSTRTPSRNSTSSSSSGGSVFSIHSRSNRSHAMKIKEGGGKKSVTSQNESKKVSLIDLLKSSSRFKKAKFSASQVEDIESQPVDIAPDSQLFI